MGLLVSLPPETSTKAEVKASAAAAPTATGSLPTARMKARIVNILTAT